MPPRARGTTQRNESTPKEKRKPVRRDPEKRRQQNIQAQKKYREKLRERLAHLEALAELAAQRRGGCTTPGKSAAGPGPEKAVALDLTSSSSDNTSTDAPTDQSFDSSASSLTAAVDGNQPFVPQLGDISLDLGLWNSATYTSLSNDPSTLNIWDHTTLPLQPDDTIWYPSTIDQLSNSTPSEENIWAPSAYAPYSVAPSTFEPTAQDNSFPPICKRHNDNPGLSWTTTIICGCSTPHFQIQSHGPRSLARGRFKILMTEPATPTADLYANNIRIDQLCTLTALYSVVKHIGIPEDMLCADESLSPFFRSTADPADASMTTETVAAVQRIFKKLKREMRPTRAQIITSHHPSLDILPFPELRNTLIKHQGEFDEDEFFHDALTGLVCWGGAGIGKRDRASSTGQISSGTPWDPRSWEAQVWFLKKYWNLLGGEDGDLVRQTEWWRAIRGDDELDVTELASGNLYGTTLFD
ncbi:hypothetical protein BJX76DRAFT_353406 [Aspergillus varians]